MLNIFKAILSFFLDIWLSLLWCIVTGRITKKETRKKKSPSFQLQNLPLLATTEIVRSMSQKEQIKLALTSKKCEAICKAARVKVLWYGIHIRDDSTNLDIGENLKLYFGTMECPDYAHDTLSQEEVIELFNLDDGSSPLQNLLSVFEKVNGIFKCNRTPLLIYLDEMEQTCLKELMDIPLFRNCKSIGLARGEVASEDLAYVFDMARELNYLRLIETEIPSDFQHDRAFLIERVEYSDAKWVTLDNLFTMKNSTYVTLGTNCLTYSEWNSFLKFWVNSEVDMFHTLKIDMKKRIDLEVLFDGLIWLDSIRFKGYNYFIMANTSMPNRKSPLLLVSHYKNELRFISSTRTSLWCVSEHPSGKRLRSDITLELEYDALEVLGQRERLKKKMEGMEEPKEEDTREMKSLERQLDRYLEEKMFTVGE